MSSVLKTIELIMIYALMKTVNIIYKIIYSDKLKAIIMLLCIIYTLDINTKINNISIYLIISITFLYLVSLINIKINNFLCIDRIKKEINMCIDIDLKALEKTNDKISILNVIVDGFVDAFNEMALHPERYHIKNGQTYKLRTHGAIYLSFYRKIKNNENMILKKEEVKEKIERTKDKKQVMNKITSRDRFIFIVDRMLVKRNIIDVLKSKSEFTNFEKIQICDIECTFNTKEKVIYFSLK